MFALSQVVMLSTEDDLRGPAVDAALDSGHSRIPIYRGNDRTDIVGLVSGVLRLILHKLLTQGSGFWALLVLLICPVAFPSYSPAGHQGHRMVESACSNTALEESEESCARHLPYFAQVSRTLCIIPAVPTFIPFHDPVIFYHVAHNLVHIPNPKRL